MTSGHSQNLPVFIWVLVFVGLRGSPRVFGAAPRPARVCALSSGVRRLTPSGSRLGFIPSLRARASRGTSLCVVFFLFLVLLVFRVLPLYFVVQAAFLPGLGR